MSGKSGKADELIELERVRLKDGRTGTVVYVSEDRQSGIVEFDGGEFRLEDYDYSPDKILPEDLDDTEQTRDITVKDVETVLE